MDSGASRRIAGRERKSTFRTVAYCSDNKLPPFLMERDLMQSTYYHDLDHPYSPPIHHHLLEMVPYWERSVGFCHKQDGHSAAAVTKSALVRGGPGH